MIREDIESFLNFLAVEKGYSENTVMAYRNDLSDLSKFAEDPKPLRKIQCRSGKTSGDRGY